MLVVLLPSALLSFSPPDSEGVRLGQPVPQFRLTDADGASIGPATYQARATVVIWAAGTIALSESQTDRLADELRAEETVLLVLCDTASWKRNGSQSNRVHFLKDERGDVARRLFGALADDATGRGWAALVDAEGILRGVQRVQPSGRGLSELARSWREGRTHYMVACARCHGDQGDDTGYPFIKSLSGIGNRLTLKEIRDRLRPVVLRQDHIVIRSFAFRENELQALVRFVAGL